MLQPQQTWGHAEKLHPGLNGHIPGQDEQGQDEEDGGVSVRGSALPSGSEPPEWRGEAPTSQSPALEPRKALFSAVSPDPTQSLLPLCPRTFGLQ